MGELVSFELVFALQAFLTGVKIAVAYDFFRIFRYIVKHGKIWCQIEDFIFSNICGLVVFSMLFTYNNGTVRGFAIFLIVIGICIYNKTVSRVFIKCVNMFTLRVRKTLQKLKKKDRMKEER